MGLKAGIVGLPNVGKSTLFNAITKAQVEAANYPFATITPNTGVVEVPDERLEKLAEIFQPKSKIAATFEFFDIAGLVKGASKGEGLGNQFLAHIREVDAICHVVRCYDDPNITHVYQTTDPLRDIEVVELELILADLETIENRLAKIERKVKSDKTAAGEYDLLSKLKTKLSQGETVKSCQLSARENLELKSFNLLSSKPVIYIANLKEEQLADYQNDKYYRAVAQFAAAADQRCLAISARYEEELNDLSSEERELFLQELGGQSGLQEITRVTYDTLGLATFFTAGPKEVRAWTFSRGMKAPQCAGVIHSDFEKGFIKAEAYSFEDLLRYKTEQAIKENGKLRIEGKDYPVKDGDVLFFRFNV